MKNVGFKILFVLVLILLFAGITSTGYSQTGAVKLVYNYPEGKTFKYFSDTKIVEDMDVNGQTMLVNVSMNMGCKIKSTGKDGESLKIEVTIDSMAQNVESPQGSVGGPISEIKGKVFNILITSAGKTTDLTEATNIVYTVQGSGENNMAESFRNFFPSLPSGPIKPGDTWVTSDTTDTKSKTNSVWMPLESNYKFEGIENVDGIDCAKITATLSGTRKMINQTEGMGEIHTSGPFTGTMTLLIAVKDGYLVKESVTTKMTGNIEIPDQSMSFPVVMNVTSTNEIVK